jgi:hypothetical protein
MFKIIVLCLSTGLLVDASLAAEAPSSAHSPASSATPQPKQKLVMGWLESIFIKPWNRRLTAKLDTGAKTSSLHADHIEHFSKNGEDWVRFDLGDTEDKKLQPVTAEKPLVRTVNIKCKGEDCQPSKRDVVLLTVCKNGKDYEAEFNLVDRSNFNYPVLLGRSFLKDVALVDASETFLYKADTDPCAGKDGGSHP